MQEDESRWPSMECTVLRLDIEKYDPDLILDGHSCIQEDGHYVPHVIPDLFALCVGAHGQILFHLAQLVHVALQNPLILLMGLQGLTTF